MQTLISAHVEDYIIALPCIMNTGHTSSLKPHAQVFPMIHLTGFTEMPSRDVVTLTEIYIYE